MLTEKQQEFVDKKIAQISQDNDWLKNDGFIYYGAGIFRFYGSNHEAGRKIVELKNTLREAFQKSPYNDQSFRSFMIFDPTLMTAVHSCNGCFFLSFEFPLIKPID